MENNNSVYEKFGEATEAIEELFESMSEMTEEQEKRVKGYYDRRGIPHNLKFGYLEDDDIVLFSIGDSSLSSWEYYSGFEYEKDKIEFKFQLSGYIIIGYSESSRAKELYDYIIGDDKEDEE